MLLDTTSAVDTPERVRFRHRIAGPGRRAAAWGIDAAIQGAVLAVAGLVALLTGVVGLGGVGTGAMLLTVFLVQWFYGAALEIAGAGRTPGKWVLGLRVVTGSGAPARPVQLVLRNLLRGADFLPVLYGVGVLVTAVDPRLRRIGDLVADTVVIDERSRVGAARTPTAPPVTADERAALPARVELTRDEIGAIEELLARRERLTEARVDELCGLLAPALTASTGVQGPTHERTVVLAWARATGRDRTLGEGAA